VFPVSGSKFVFRFTFEVRGSRFGVPGFRGSGVPGFRGSGVPGFGGSGTLNTNSEPETWNPERHDLPCYDSRHLLAEAL